MPQLLGREIGAIGYGMMGLTTRSTPVPTDRSIQALRAALESGCNFWNAGEFYGPPGNNSLTLLAMYFRQYPEDASKVVLSVKGAFDGPTMKPDCTPEGLKTSIDNILAALDGTKTIDIFEFARVDPNVPLETSLGFLEKEYVSKGIVGGVAVSEVSAATLRKAAGITKIVGVEVELSLWSTHVLENGVADACAELGVPLIAYSPIGKGMLTGQIRSFDDIPEGDFRRFYPRFQPENFAINLQLVDQLTELAKQKGCTAAQLAINWTIALGKKQSMPTIIPIPGATLDRRVRENAVVVNMTDEELAAIDAVLAKAPVVGARFPDFVPVDG